MDKETFWHQLESAITNSDKNLFIDTILDLPPDVIIGFTIEEFSRIVTVSKQIDLHDPDYDLLKLFEDNGQFFLNKGLNEVDKLNNFIISRFYYRLFIAFAGNNAQRIKYALHYYAIICCELAEMDIDIIENLETAISLYTFLREIFPIASEQYNIDLFNELHARLTLAESIDSEKNLEIAILLSQIAQKTFSKQSFDYVSVLKNEGVARAELAKMGVNSIQNLEIALQLYEIAKNTFPEKSENWACMLGNEGCARQTLAEIGVNSIQNLEIAVCLHETARKVFQKTSANYARALENEGTTRKSLAEMGVNSIQNLEIAVCLHETARKVFQKTSANYARVLVNEGVARAELAEMGVNSIQNLEIAVCLYETAKKIFPEKSKDCASALMNEGIARRELAEMGVNSIQNLEIAVFLHETTQNIFQKTSVSYARALMNEGNARQTLAEIGVDSKENLEIAVRLHETAKKIFPETSDDYASALMNEGIARQGLSEISVYNKGIIETAVNLYKTAQNIFQKTSASYAMALSNEGNARFILAEMGVDSMKNFETAVHLYETSQKVFEITSINYAVTLMNEGSVRSRLVDMNIDDDINFARSKKLYLESISILDKIGDGWKYSIVLLNFNSLLKSNFIKTGDKKYLEEWESNLGDIEEKIKDRDIMYKEILMASIHEIHASLFELDGISGLYYASLEYDKAYEILKIPYYKFMNEFYRARINNKSFCELVSDWKEVEKEGIFLDYYDYAVYECHLDNARESTIDEKNELKLAKEKLIEIRDRTPIKVIKDRVSAYIHLMQALIVCFNEYPPYKEAEKNVEEGYRIFIEYGDKSGQQMCKIFHKAIKENNQQNAWSEIKPNRELSSNFYNLLCDLSYRKRAALDYNMFNQMIATFKDVSEKVECIVILLNSLKPGIKEELEISSGIEIGGTGAKLIVKIPLQEISYTELKEDLKKIEGKYINKLSEIPIRLASKIKGYLSRTGREDIIDKLI